MKGINKNPASEVGALGNLSDPLARTWEGPPSACFRSGASSCGFLTSSCSVLYPRGNCPFKVLAIVVGARALSWTAGKASYLSF